MPDQIVGEHTKEDMRADASGQAVVDGADLEVDRLDRAEGSLHLAEALVGEHGGGAVEVGGGQAGAQHINAIQGGLTGDGGGIPREAEGGIVDGELEMLGHLAATEYGADAQPDLVLATERLLGALDGGLDAAEIGFGGGEQVVPLGGTLGGQGRVA